MIATRRSKLTHKVTKFKFILILGVLIVLTLTSIILIWLSQPSGERYLASHLESILANALSQPVKLDRLETNLFSRVEITGLMAAHDFVVKVKIFKQNYFVNNFLGSFYSQLRQLWFRYQTNDIILLKLKSLTTMVY